MAETDVDCSQYDYSSSRENSDDEHCSFDPKLFRNTPFLPLKREEVKTSLCKLSRKLVLKLFTYVDAADVLTLTSVCRYLHSICFTRSFMTAMHLSRWVPLGIERSSYQRRYFIEAQRKAAVYSTYDRPMRSQLSASARTARLLLVREVGGRMLYFSEVGGKLCIWGLENEREKLHYSIDCESQVLAVDTAQGKVTLASTTGTVEVKSFPWHEVRAADITGVKYHSSEKVVSGSVLMYPKHGLVAAVLDNYMYVLTETMELVQKFREKQWPVTFIQCRQVDACMPYIAVATSSSVLVYDLSMRGRTAPVYVYAFSLLSCFEFQFVVAATAQRTRSFLVLHNNIKFGNSEVSVNGKTLCKDCAASTVFRLYLVALSQCSLTVRQYRFDVQGPALVRSFQLHEWFLNATIACTDERLLIVGRREHTKNSYKAMCTDFVGWRFSYFLLKDLEPEGVQMTASAIVITGKCLDNDRKVLMQFKTCAHDDSALEISKRVQYLTKFSEKRNFEQEQKQREEEFLQRRIERKKRQADDKEREKLRNSTYWKPSRRGRVAVELDEDFTLV